MMAILLSFFLLVPITPVFSLGDSSLNPSLQMPPIPIYTIEIEGPTQVVIPYFESLLVNYTAKVYMHMLGQPLSTKVLVPEAQVMWMPYARPGFSVFPENLGLSRTGSQVTIPVNAMEGTYGLVAMLTLNRSEVASESIMDMLPIATIETKVIKRIPRIAFVNAADDFNLAIPYVNRQHVINYTAKVVDQYDVVIANLTPKVRKVFASTANVGAYYDDSLDRLTLAARPGYAGTIRLEAYIDEFEVLDADANLALAKQSPTPTPIPAPVYSVQKDIVISRERDYPAYGMLEGDERIAIPRNGEITKSYQYEIFSQYGVLLEDMGNLASFIIPSGQPADIDVDLDDQVMSVKVDANTPHSFLHVYVKLTKMEPVELDQMDGMTEEAKVEALMNWRFAYRDYTHILLYLDKTVYGTMDDANNTVDLEQDGDIEYRIANSIWRDYISETNPRFPGNMNVAFRYKDSYMIEPSVKSAEINGIGEKPEGYGPSQEKLFNFTVLAPTIAVDKNPLTVGEIAEVSISYNELHPYNEIRPADTSQDLVWYDPYGVPYIATKSQWYKFGDAVDWNRYTQSFNVTQNTTVFAKTIVNLSRFVFDGVLKVTKSNNDQVNFAGDYSSSIVQKDIVFETTTIPTTTVAPTTTTVATTTTGPAITTTIAPTTTTIAPTTTGPAITTTIAPITNPPFTGVETSAPIETIIITAGEATTTSTTEAVIIIPETTVPLGSLETETTTEAPVTITESSSSELVFNDVETPLGDATLPETNELPISILYGLGILISGFGYFIVKRKDEE